MTRKKIIGVVGPRNTPIGEDHHNAKLADWQVEEIRKLYETGVYGYRRLARFCEENYGVKVHRVTIRDIVTNRRRACTPDQYKTVEGPPSVFSLFSNYEDE
ncbi:MAG: hypothetical protein IT558_00660 [Alphaproteobacteria bacterium]|nr:hypothetical protein [Alphaproteobacteria bacterium]